MDHLGRRPDGDGVGPAIVRADDAAAFHRHAGVALGIEAAPQAVRRGGERRGGRALLDHEFADLVGMVLLVNKRGAGLDRALGIDDRR